MGRGILLLLLFIGSHSVFAESTLIDAEEVERISERIWETRQSLLLARPAYELCKNASEEVFVSGDYKDTKLDNRKLRRCVAWLDRQSSRSLKYKANYICNQVAEHRAFSYTYWDDEGSKTVVDSKKLECFERAANLMGLRDLAMECRRRYHPEGKEFLPPNRSYLQQILYCNESLALAKNYKKRFKRLPASTKK